MRLFNFCGSSKSKSKFNSKDLPTSFVAKNLTFQKVDLSPRRFNSEIAMYRCRGAILRIYTNGTVTFAGMSSMNRCLDAVRGLLNKRRVDIELHTVKGMVKRAPLLNCTSKRVGPERTFVQEFRNGIVIATGRSTESVKAALS